LPRCISCMRTWMRPASLAWATATTRRGLWASLRVPSPYLRWRPRTCAAQQRPAQASVHGPARPPHRGSGRAVERDRRWSLTSAQPRQGAALRRARGRRRRRRRRPSRRPSRRPASTSGVAAPGAAGPTFARLGGHYGRLGSLRLD